MPSERSARFASLRHRLTARRPWNRLHDLLHRSVHRPRDHRGRSTFLLVLEFVVLEICRFGNAGGTQYVLGEGRYGYGFEDPGDEVLAGDARVLGIRIEKNPVCEDVRCKPLDGIWGHKTQAMEERVGLARTHESERSTRADAEARVRQLSRRTRESDDVLLDSRAMLTLRTFN